MKSSISGHTGDVPQAAQPLTVSVKRASRLLDIGTTTMWSLIRGGKVDTVGIGRRRLVVYASLVRLIGRPLEKVEDDAR